MRRILLSLMLLVAMTAAAQNTIVHIVQQGETLASIAKKYKTSVASIKAGNPDAKSDIYPGMRLEIPSSSSSPVNAAQTYSQANNAAYTSPQQQEPSTMPSSSVSTDNTPTDGLVGGEDYTFMLDPDNKIYGIRMNMYPGNMIGVTWSMWWQAMSHGSYEGRLGIGFAPRYAAGPVVMGFHLYPYVSLLGYDEFEGLNKYDKATYKNKTKVSYGAAVDIMAGIKLWTTAKGTRGYLTGSYEVAAPEFKTKNAFKNGLWGVGISIIGIGD